MTVFATFKNTALMLVPEDNQDTEVTVQICITATHLT